MSSTSTTPRGTRFLNESMLLTPTVDHESKTRFISVTPPKPRQFTQEELRELFQEKPSKKEICLKTLKAIPFAIINSDNTSLINSLFGLARSVYGLVKDFFRTLIHVSRVIAATELSRAFSLPFDIYSFVLNGFGMIADRGEAKIDAFLGLIGNVSDIGDGISAIGSVLIELGALGATWSNLMGPLSAGCAALSAVFILMNARSLYFSTKVIKELNQQLNIDKPNYRGAAKVLKTHHYALENHCGVDTQLVKDKIRSLYIQKQYLVTAEEKENVNDRLDDVFRSLKTRIRHKQFTEALGMVITKIGIVATALFIFSPLCPALSIAGLSLLVVLSTLSMSKMAFDFYARLRFQRTIRQL
ncbi:MAG: hypothetical protein ACSNEK_04515 [Parachlamydiaceae bacterium]